MTRIQVTNGEEPGGGTVQIQIISRGEIEYVAAQLGPGQSYTIDVDAKLRTIQIAELPSEEDPPPTQPEPKT